MERRSNVGVRLMAAPVPITEVVCDVSLLERLLSLLV